MSDGFFVVKFLPDLQNHNDFAFKWQGWSGNRDRAGTFAMSAAKSAWYAYASAMGQQHSPLPNFISAKHRIIRASDAYLDSGWTINTKHFKTNPTEYSARSDLTTESMINFFDFLMAKIDLKFQEHDVKKRICGLNGGADPFRKDLFFRPLWDRLRSFVGARECLCFKC